MIGADLRAFLLSDGTIAALVGERVHPMILPQGSLFPALTYQTISVTPLHTLDGPVRLRQQRIQLDVWSETFATADTLAEAIKTKLDGFKGQWGGSPGLHVQGAFYDQERELYESEPTLYRRTMDFLVWLEL